MENPELCVASSLKKYISLTQQIRKRNDDILFLTVNASHHRAGKQMISPWVKEMLKTVGIDTSIFTPHSTRHAAASAALRRGVPLKTICKTAGWSEQTNIFIIGLFEKKILPLLYFLINFMLCYSEEF